MMDEIPICFVCDSILACGKCQFCAIYILVDAAFRLILGVMYFTVSAILSQIPFSHRCEHTIDM